MTTQPARPTAPHSAQVAAIEETFAAARKPPVHPTKPGMRALDIMEGEAAAHAGWCWVLGAGSGCSGCWVLGGAGH